MTAGERIGRFRVLGTLGAGANSQILHVRRQADGKQYALKVVPLASKDDHKFLEQARHEFRVSGMLDHPHLIKVFALETPRDWLFRVRKAHLLIEYVNGKTMDEVPPLPLDKLVQVFHRVSGALAHMHRRKVLHADMKPNNLLLSRTGDVKVIDYGLAWVKGEKKDRIQGTPEYMAPETIKHKVVDERTDLFNFGATMYRLATMRNTPKLFQPAPGVAVLDAKSWKVQLRPATDFNPRLPPALSALIGRCLEYDSANRPKRVGEVHDELGAMVEAMVNCTYDKLDALEW